MESAARDNPDTYVIYQFVFRACLVSSMIHSFFVILRKAIDFSLFSIADIFDQFIDQRTRRKFSVFDDEWKF